MIQPCANVNDQPKADEQHAHSPYSCQNLCIPEESHAYNQYPDFISFYLIVMTEQPVCKWCRRQTHNLAEAGIHRKSRQESDQHNHQYSRTGSLQSVMPEDATHQFFPRQFSSYQLFSEQQIQVIDVWKEKQLEQQETAKGILQGYVILQFSQVEYTIDDFTYAVINPNIH